MKRVATTAIEVASAVWLVACGTTETTTYKEATYGFVPATATAEPASGLTYTIVGDDTHPDKVIEYPWKTSFSVTIADNAGVGRKITAVSLRVQQASGGIVITPTSGIEYYQYTSRASGNRVEAKGSASIGFDAWYDLPSKGREALVTVTFSYLDDDDQSFSESASVQVQ